MPQVTTELPQIKCRYLPWTDFFKHKEFLIEQQARILSAVFNFKQAVAGGILVTLCNEQLSPGFWKGGDQKCRSAPQIEENASFFPFEMEE